MTRARRIAALAACATVALGAFGQTGCALSRATGRALSALVSSPRKVKKERRPVQPDAGLAVTWVGHATAIVQIDDKVIVTDPVFTRTVGELSKRLVERGVDPDDVPPIDAVLISHMHFDHLSLGSLDMLEGKVRTLLMPPGGTTYLTDFSFPVVELPTWQVWEKDGLRVTAVPVDHVGFRYGIDAAWMRRSFTGYVVEYHDMTVYFPGDTAYDQKDFVRVAERFPEIDVAFLPIAPIHPPGLMRRFHLDPEQAVQAFIDLGAKWMVPIHYDTFVDSTDEPGEALARLKAATTKWDLGESKVVTLAPGERHLFIPKAKEEPEEEDEDEWEEPSGSEEPDASEDMSEPADEGGGFGDDSLEDDDDEPAPAPDGEATTPGDRAPAPGEKKPGEKEPGEKKPGEKVPEPVIPPSSPFLPGRSPL